MLITDLLRHNGECYGEKIALVESDPEKNRRREISWESFDRTADRVAAALSRAGITRGDRVGHLMMNCLEWLPIYFGILRAGAWAVPLNFRFDAVAIRRCLETVEAKALFFGSEFIERIDAEKPRLDRHLSHYVHTGPGALKPGYALSLEDFVSGGEGIRTAVDLKPEDTAAVYFTSGTTGRPKGVRLSHGSLAFSCRVERAHHHHTREDVFLCIPPLYHTGAKMHWFGNLAAGGRAVLLKGTRPEWILEAISREKVTIVWLLVPWAHDILTAVESGALRLEAFELDQWRLMHIGAQPVAPGLIRRWRRLFPGQAYDTNYGLTEATGPGCVHLGCDNMHKVGAIGRPGEGWEYRIVTEDLDDVVPGRPGELAVRGAGVMQGYFGDSAATAAVLVDGWLLTGDIAREDEDGFIWMVDRKKDVVICGGENIFPVEIESFLLEHPDIQDAAVIGVPHERLGEIAAAIVQPKAGRSVGEKEILDFCEGLPRYKRPRRIHFGMIPRNPTGKIEKPRLRKRYANPC